MSNIPGRLREMLAAMPFVLLVIAIASVVTGMLFFVLTVYSSHISPWYAFTHISALSVSLSIAVGAGLSGAATSQRPGAIGAMAALGATILALGLATDHFAPVPVRLTFIGAGMLFAAGVGFEYVEREFQEAQRIETAIRRLHR